MLHCCKKTNISQQEFWLSVECLTHYKVYSQRQSAGFRLSMVVYIKVISFLWNTMVDFVSYSNLNIHRNLLFSNVVIYNSKVICTLSFQINSCPHQFNAKHFPDVLIGTRSQNVAGHCHCYLSHTCLYKYIHFCTLTCS